MTTLFVLGSTRRGGNSEGLARRAAEALSAGEARFLSLLDHEPPPFRDHRHDGADWQAPGDYLPGPLRTLHRATRDADRIVLVTPLCWYGPSWLTKLYLDWWTAWETADEGFSDALAGRALGQVTAYSSEDEAAVDALSDMLRRTSDYLGMDWMGRLCARANAPGGWAEDAAATARARAWLA